MIRRLRKVYAVVVFLATDRLVDVDRGQRW